MYIVDLESPCTCMFVIVCRILISTLHNKLLIVIVIELLSIKWPRFFYLISVNFEFDKRITKFFFLKIRKIHFVKFTHFVHVYLLYVIKKITISARVWADWTLLYSTKLLYRNMSRSTFSWALFLKGNYKIIISITQYHHPFSANINIQFNIHFEWFLLKIQEAPRIFIFFSFFFL